MKKYIPIFGPQELFDGAPDECFCVAKNVYDANVFYKSENLSLFWFDDEKWKPLSFMSCTPLAMRRIIAEPKRWTVEDQKAGKLPKVGAKLIYTETRDVFEFVGVIAGSMRWACKDFQDGFLYFFEQSEMSPIESPEEKAARLRSEWCNKAAKQLKNLEYISTLTSIYDALLSGELQAPKGGE